DRRDDADQLVSALDRLAIYGCDGVPRLQSGFFRRLAGDDLRDGHARLHAVNARYCRAGLGAELHADGATRNPVLRSSQLVVDVTDGIRGHGKTHALVAE